MKTLEQAYKYEPIDAVRSFPTQTWMSWANCWVNTELCWSFSRLTDILRFFISPSGDKTAPDHDATTSVTLLNLPSNSSFVYILTQNKF